MDEMSYMEKSELPASLLLDPVTGNAAAYTNNHRLVTPMASGKLLAYAQAHEAKRAAWDEALRDPTGVWRPLPEWATDEVRTRCVLVWLNRPTGDDDAAWREIPKR